MAIPSSLHRLVIAFRRRLILLLGLACWLAFAVWMIIHAPAFPPGNWPRLQVQSEGKIASLSTTRNFGDNYFVERWLVDLSSGEIVEGRGLEKEIAGEENSFIASSLSGNIVRWSYSQRIKERRRAGSWFLSISIYDPISHQLKDHWEIKISSFGKYTGSIEIVNERFFMHGVLGGVEVLDVANLQAGWTNTVLAPGQIFVPLVSENDKDNRFLFVQTGLKTDRRAELHEIDTNGKIKQLAHWEIGAPHDFLSRVEYNSLSTRWKDRIASIDVEMENVEIRSAIDGILLEKISLPESFDPTKISWSLAYGCLVLEYPKSTRILDLQSKKWFSDIEKTVKRFYVITGAIILVDQSIDGELLSAVQMNLNSRRHLILRRSTGEVFGPFSNTRASPSHSISLISSTYIDGKKEDYYAESNREYGASLLVRKIEDESIVRIYHPFAWVVPALIILLVSYGIWSFFWCLESAKYHGSAWRDVALVGGIPLLLLAARIFFRSSPEDLKRYIYAYAYGISIAIAMLASAWLILGNTRLSIRMLPLGIFCVFMTGMLNLGYSHSPTVAWQAMAIIMVPAFVSVLLVGIMRLLGCRLYLHKTQGEPTNPIQHRSQHRTSKVLLKDILLWTVLASLIFAAMRPFQSGISVIKELDYSSLIIPLLISQAVVLIGLLSLRSHRWIFLGIAAVPAIAGLYYLTEEVLREHS